MNLSLEDMEGVLGLKDNSTKLIDLKSDTYIEGVLGLKDDSTKLTDLKSDTYIEVENGLDT